MLSKKAQVSIEVLTILSILVIGSIIFGVYYLSTVRKNIDVVAGFDSPPNLYVEDPYGIGPTEDSVTPAEGGFDIDLTLDPNTNSAPYVDFNINVKLLTVYNMYGDMNVKEISVYKWNQLLGNYDISDKDCNYSGTPITNKGLSVNIPIGKNNEESANLQFSCSETGTYKFIITAKGTSPTGKIPESTDNITKEIGSSGSENPDLQLYLVPNESTPQGVGKNKRFGIDVNLSNFTAGHPVIKKIQVFETADNNKVDVCYYGGNKIEKTGRILSISMNQESSNKYSYLLNDISCSQAGDYYIFITAGESGNINNDINAPIIKTISSLSATLSLVPDGNSQAFESFGINVFVDNYNLNSAYNINENQSRIQVTRISVVDANTGQPTANCKYFRYTISTVGFEIPDGFNLTQTPNSNDYNGKIENISCSSPGTYNFTFTVHDSKENKIYDYNATIPKIIHNVAFNRCKDVFTTGDIHDASELDCVRYYLSRDYKLVNDIDLNHALLSSDSTATWYDDESGWWPIGTEQAWFTGSLDGNGYSINNLYKSMPCGPYGFDANRNFFGGLFGVIQNAEIKNLYLHNIDNSGHDNYALPEKDTRESSEHGSNGLAWLIYGSVIENVHIDGNQGLSALHSSPNGMAQHVYDSNFTNCSFTGKIRGAGSFKGGLIGVIYPYPSGPYPSGNTSDLKRYSYITNCSTDINMYPQSSDTIFNGVGGLVGANYGGIIINSHSTGNINSFGGGSGGLVALNATYNENYYPQIHNSWSDVNLIGTEMMSGLVCGNIGGVIANSYARGDVNSSYRWLPVLNINISPYAGGLSAARGGIIINSYSTGAPIITTASGCTPPYCGSAGGLIAGLGADGDVVNSFWDLLNSGVTYSNGGIGKTTTEMKTQSTFSDWDFENIWLINSTTNDGYPYLNPAYVGDYDIYFDPPALTPSQQAILQIQNNTWAQNSLNTEGMAN